MGEKMNKLVDLLKEEESEKEGYGVESERLQAAVSTSLSEILGQPTSLEEIRNFEDPDENPEVIEILREIVRANTLEIESIDTEELTEDEKETLDISRDIRIDFLAACKRAGIDLGIPLDEGCIIRLKEKFTEDLDTTLMFMEMEQDRITLEAMLYEKGLKDFPEEVLAILAEQFDFDPNGKPFKRYIMKGIPGEEGEGDNKVTVFRTNRPDVFISKIEYADGDVTWAFQPETLEDEEEVELL